MYPLPVSATPSPLRMPAPTTTSLHPDSPTDRQGAVPRERGTWEKGTTGRPTTVRRKRKVLRYVLGTHGECFILVNILLGR